MLFDRKFDLVISLGEDCACTSYLRRFNLQDYSFPFDWLTKASFETRINLLVNDFENFLNKENLVLIPKPENTNVDNKHDYYKDTVLDFYFYRDFKSNTNFEKEFIDVKNKYLRRIERLYNAIESSENILFVWWSRDKHQDEAIINSSYDKLKDKFKNKEIYLLIIEFSEIQITKDLCNNKVLLIQYDNVSYKHNPKWNETMGNEANNLKIFSQIRKLRTMSWYLRIFIFKLVKFFIGLIPNQSLRHKLKNDWSYKFFKSKL